VITKPTRKILVPTELKSSEWGTFFEQLGFELIFKHVKGDEYLFAVDNACPDYLSIPRLKTKNDIDPQLAPFVRSFISKNYIDSILGKNLLTAYFNEGLEFDLIESYSKDFKNIYTLKIHEYLNVGYFIDSVIVEAYKGKFNINKLRTYLNAAMNYTFNKVETSERTMPIDVSYSHNSEAFTVMISMDIDSFGGLGELGEYLSILTENSNFFDIAYFHKKNRLTLSCLLFKDKKLLMNSYFFTEIAAKLPMSKMHELNADVILGLGPHDNVKYELRKTSDEQFQKLAIALKFVLFIKNYRNGEEAPKRMEKLDLNDIDDYLDFYPRQESLHALDEETKNIILKLLKDDQLFLGISDYTKARASSNLDSHINEIQRILGEKSLNDVEELLMISGSEANDQDFTRVKGWGVNDNNGVWQIKRSEINEKIQDEIIRISSEGRNIIQDDIIRVVAKALDANEDDVKIVVSGIVEEVASIEFVKKQKLEEAFALKILGNKPSDLSREELLAQVVRMKKIMEQLRAELIRLQKINAVTIDNSTDEEGSEVVQLKIELARTIEALKLREFFIEKTKEDFEILVKNKDMKIESLISQVQGLKDDFARSKEFANQEKMQQLELENKSLAQRLELASKKVNIINENIENRDNLVLEKLEREVESLKSNLQMSLSVIQRFKKDKIEMDARFSEQRDARRKEKDERIVGTSLSGLSKEEMLEKDMAIVLLSNEKKAAEEKLHVQGIELKKIEQKLKYTIAQLDSASKRKASPIGGSQKSAEQLVKELEVSKSKLYEATSDVAEKRKEMNRLKLENSMMTNKIAELEKKLAHEDKKAS
jgi:hypothetical protein